MSPFDTTLRAPRRTRPALPDPALVRADAPCVVITGANRLVPQGLDRPSIAAWLAAPIAGVPLARRVLEPVVGLEVSVLDVISDRAAPAFASAVNAGPCFGMCAGVIDSAESVSVGERPLIVLPCVGVYVGDIGPAVREPAPVGGWAVIPLRGDDGSRAVVVVASAESPKEPLLRGVLDIHTVEAAAQDLGIPCVRRAAGRYLRTDSPVALRHAAQTALREDWTGGQAIGVRRDAVLVGARAWIGRETLTGAAAAIGEESFVSIGAEIDDGAVIGARCYVGPGAVVRDAVLLDGAEVAPGEIVEGVVRIRTRDVR